MKKGIVIGLSVMATAALLLSGCKKDTYKGGSAHTTTTASMEQDEAEESINSYTLEYWNRATSEERRVVMDMFNAVIMNAAPEKTITIYTVVDIERLLNENPDKTLRQIIDQELTKY